jgi:hypothetical protein
LCCSLQFIFCTCHDHLIVREKAEGSCEHHKES